ncbi:MULTISPECIES: dipeptide/oligopeptide/nickel ABC transporter permease/ATP-binding protein [unclassified Streptomyces]|uniref:dipeptide/oligopeptide/nickel ABC transporter permease/ATP-binding protein n=1 Tax=unclassified Streptomyces TaxID=2593676 RepID=UPI001163B4C3|nr:MULTISPECIES: dipeptide/oligopeptide/nickel ABC transporter permease/ATP-binding protein [unclassified Streptomyces]NMI58206.1 dipeptide/oligopeptide/nickel ABC transporter permease/ATP-binding protein [Streptomyces sp. RLA2-12]QDN57579.1 dipeptide/oligopeptide/nickel ABC transporter permease/ATP-binding protein [Streptomyces sp. S1D4-20]QDN67676.1 dipeptide/oligopeptide/nickel ABC transporter permease/ATP-binding protein [Streptomyces sp. S1D4-14]QDO50089.1 dipeptide/oligopeptide/nickel ABC
MTIPPLSRRRLTEGLARPGIRLRRLPVLSRIALGFLTLVVLLAVFAPLLAPHDPLDQQPQVDGTGAPSGGHWMGQDSLGRDILSRLMYGARWSLAIGLGATSLALVVGALLGAIAATSRGAVDETLMRCLDVVMAFPGIALAAVLVAVFGGGITVLICAIAFLFTPSVARVVRANVLDQYGEDYVTAERVIGARTPHIVLRHVAVNCAAPVLVFCTVQVAEAIVFEASLSFIGAGVRPPDPSWGSVIADGKNMVLTGGWWATVFPGLLMLITVLSLNILSEGVSDAWAAPVAREVAAKATAGDRLEAPEPGSGEVLELPGLTEAAARLRSRARPLPTGRPVLSVENLAIGFEARHGGVDIVDGIGFDVHPGEVLGLVGESGCGKSLTALAVMGLEPKGARVRGHVRFDQRQLVGEPMRVRRRLLGHEMAMVYQDALSSLNPAMTIRAQLKQLVRRGGRQTPAELLALVGLDPERTLRSYPHELSGGQRQRVLIAMALSRGPKLIVADEPTTALDVTVQAQIITLLLKLREELGFALILVSHDLALVADVTDRVVVMYGGQIVETGVTADLVEAPAHHYTRGLLGSVLSLESAAERMTQIKGVVPAPADFPAGCRFADRCPLASEVCRTTAPDLLGSRTHTAACHHPAVDLITTESEAVQ